MTAGRVPHEPHASRPPAPPTGMGAHGGPGGGSRLLPRYHPGQVVQIAQLRLTIERRLSGPQSGQGELYLVRHGQVARVLKLYFPPADGTRGPSETALTQIKEMEAPELLRLREFGVLPGEAGEACRFELTDYAEGGDLLGGLNSGSAYSPDYLRSTVVPQIHRGLVALHARGIHHLDLKPSNVFFLDAARKRLVIGDYGSVREAPVGARSEVHAASEQLSLKVTRPYMAPEVAINLFTVKADYFSLGMLVLHLLQPQSFLKQKPAEERAKRLLQGLPPSDPVPAVHGSLDILIEGLTLHDWNDRWGPDQVQAWIDGKLKEVRRSGRGAEIKIDERRTLRTAAEVAHYVTTDPSWEAVLLGQDPRAGRLYRWVDQALGAVPADALAERLRNPEEPRAAWRRQTVVRSLTPEVPIEIDGTAYDLWGAADPLPVAQAAARQLRAAYPAVEAAQLRLWGRMFEVTLDRMEEAGRQREAVVGAREPLTAVLKELFQLEHTRTYIRSTIGRDTTSTEELGSLLVHASPWPELVAGIEGELAARRAIEQRRLHDGLLGRLEEATPEQLPALIREAALFPDIRRSAAARLRSHRWGGLWRGLRNVAILVMGVAIVAGLAILVSKGWTMGANAVQRAASEAPGATGGVAALPSTKEVGAAPPLPAPPAPAPPPKVDLDGPFVEPVPPSLPPGSASAPRQPGAPPASHGRAAASPPGADLQDFLDDPPRPTRPSAPAPMKVGAPVKCGPNQDPVTKAICSSDELKEQDAKVAATYVAKRSKLDVGEAEVLFTVHRAWLGRRLECARSVDLRACVEGLHQEQLDELEKW